MTVLAALMGCQGLDCFQAMAPAALRSGLSPVELKELVYQGTAYLGLGRVLPFLKAVNEALTAAGVPLPLEEQGPRKAATSTAGWPATALAIIIPAAGWITGTESLSPSAFWPPKVAVNLSSLATPPLICGWEMISPF